MKNFSNPYLTMFNQNMKMWQDTAQVLNHRLPLLEGMRNDPETFMNPMNWLEVNKMIWEKFSAFSMAFTATTPDMLKMMNSKGNDGMKFFNDSLKLQQKFLKPIQQEVSNNAKRLGK